LFDPKFLTYDRANFTRPTIFPQPVSEDTIPLLYHLGDLPTSTYTPLDQPSAVPRVDLFLLFSPGELRLIRFVLLFVSWLEFILIYNSFLEFSDLRRFETTLFPVLFLPPPACHYPFPTSLRFRQFFATSHNGIVHLLIMNAFSADCLKSRQTCHAS